LGGGVAGRIWLRRTCHRPIIAEPERGTATD
jgi:hypothetical protein